MLMTNWEELIDFADRRNFEVNDFKQTYSTVTKEEVKNFQTQIKEEYEKYMQKGPGTSNVSLEEGVQLLTESKEKINQFNKKREENVSAEKLFNLEISKYPELIAMEELNKKYDKIYDVFNDYNKKVEEFSAMSWTKMDAQQLITAAEHFFKVVSRLGNNLEKAESMPPYNKLKETIFGFKESLPLIEMLKNPAIQERHWKRIMEETGKDLGDINLKTLTLAKVFQLELQNFEDKVTEICLEAKEEAKNEDNLQKIEQAWKITNFTVGIYVKNGIERGHYIGSVEEISQTLEDNILILQSLAASKYVRSIKTRVSQWEKDLNTIADVKD
jgi:dynein heavy chain